MRIQHNIMAMNAYRNYNNNTSALSKNLEKLSSGYRINRAGDDAAGLAISEKMRAQITGLDAAQKNVKDGISLVKTAEGAMQEIQDMLNRMDYLATQSANGTYQDKVDREALQDEVEALLDEIDRIAQSANFNGQKLLDGTLDGDATAAAAASASAAADANSFTAITAGGDLTTVQDYEPKGEAKKMSFVVDLTSLKFASTSTGDETVTIISNGVTLTATVSAGSGQVSGSSLSVAAGGTTGTVTVGTGTGAASFEFSFADGKLTFTQVAEPTTIWEGGALEGVGSGSTTDGGTITVNNGDSVKAQITQEAVAGGLTKQAEANFDLTADMVKDGARLKIGTETYVFQVGKGSTASGGTVVDLTDLTPGSDGKLTDAQLKTAALRLSGVAEGKGDFIVSNDADSKTIHLTQRVGTDEKGEKYDLAGPDNTTKDATWEGVVSYSTTPAPAGSSSGSGSSTGKLTLQIGDDNATYNQLDVKIKSMKRDSLGLDGLSIKDIPSAQGAIDKIKAAINTVSSVRGKLGAIQNRLEHTGNNLSVMAENIQDAESTIRDTDVADEMMKYVKNNILVQSAQAMLAQANQVPQGVLQLLG